MNHFRFPTSKKLTLKHGGHYVERGWGEQYIGAIQTYNHTHAFEE